MDRFPQSDAMNKSISAKLVEAAGSLELGRLLGQQAAFGLIAGRCSAAEAAAIRRLREERLYAASKLNWKQFCPLHLGMSRTQADHLILLLEEFGPEYFEVTQLTRVSAEGYRAIAPAVRDGHIHWQSEAIALLPENSEKVAAAVAGLRDAAKAEVSPAQTKEHAAAPDAREGTMNALKQRADQLVAEWARLVAVRVTFPPQQRQTMKNLIGRTRLEMERLERQVWNQGR
jgi:hypothetical protein